MEPIKHRLIMQLGVLLCFVILAGCAPIPLINDGQDALMKSFPDPLPGSSGLYVFRDTADSGLLKKRLFLDGEILGDTGMFIYFYKSLNPGTYTLATQAEFGEHSITFDALATKNTYVRQKIVRGVLMASAELEIVDEQEGKQGVLKCYLAQEGAVEELPTKKLLLK